MPFLVEIHDEARAQLDALELPKSVRLKFLTTALDELESITKNKLPVWDWNFEGPILRTYVCAIPDGGLLHHFVCRISCGSEHRRICRIEHRITHSASE